MLLTLTTLRNGNTSKTFLTDTVCQLQINGNTSRLSSWLLSFSFILTKDLGCTFDPRDPEGREESGTPTMEAQPLLYVRSHCLSTH